MGQRRRVGATPSGLCARNIFGSSDKIEDIVEIREFCGHPALTIENLTLFLGGCVTPIYLEISISIKRMGFPGQFQDFKSSPKVIVNNNLPPWARARYSRSKHAIEIPGQFLKDFRTAYSKRNSMIAQDAFKSFYHEDMHSRRKHHEKESWFTDLGEHYTRKLSSIEKKIPRWVMDQEKNLTNAGLHIADESFANFAGYRASQWMIFDAIIKNGLSVLKTDQEKKEFVKSQAKGYEEALKKPNSFGYINDQRGPWDRAPGETGEPWNPNLSLPENGTDLRKSMEEKSGVPSKFDEAFPEHKKWLNLIGFLV